MLVRQHLMKFDVDNDVMAENEVYQGSVKNEVDLNVMDMWTFLRQYIELYCTVLHV